MADKVGAPSLPSFLTLPEKIDKGEKRKGSLRSGNGMRFQREEQQV